MAAGEKALVVVGVFLLQNVQEERRRRRS